MNDVPRHLYEEGPVVNVEPRGCSGLDRGRGSHLSICVLRGRFDPTLTASETRHMMPCMDLSAKNLDEPDEVVKLPGLIEEVVEVGGFVVGRETVEPGWRWS